MYYNFNIKTYLRNKNTKKKRKKIVRTTQKNFKFHSCRVNNIK